jgi:hypothetical protein
MHSSVREANFQALLSDDSEMRSHVRDLVEVYEAIRTEDVRGTRLAHMVHAAHPTQQPELVYDGMHLRDSSLPDSVLESFVQFLNCNHRTTAESSNLNSLIHPVVSTEAKFMNSISLRGVQYSTTNYRTRNSHVLFRPFRLGSTTTGKALGHSKPGQITHIFLHSLSPSPSSPTADGSSHNPYVYLVVQPYGSLQAELGDTDQMYRRFGFAGGFLCSRELGPTIIIEPSNIISHVAVTPQYIKGHPLLHVLPMDRVRLDFTSEIKG